MKTKFGYDVDDDSDQDESYDEQESLHEQQPEDDSYDEDLDLRRVPNEDLLAMILSWCKDKETMVRVLETFKFVDERTLAKQVRKSRANEDECWGKIESVQSTYTHKQIRKAMLNSSGVAKRNAFDAVRKLMWDNGGSNITLGTNPNDFLEAGASIPMFVETMGDLTEFIQDVEAQKKKWLTNPIKAIVACFPQDKIRGMKTAEDRYQAVKSLITLFDQGKGNAKLDVTKFKLPTEAGVTLPHTMDPKEWLGASVAVLMKKLFPNSYVSFNASDVQDIRQTDSDVGSYIMYDEDPSSPFWKGRTPALYCRGTDANGTWLWRNASAVVSARVAVEIKRDPSRIDEVDAMRKDFLREIADEYVAKSEVKECFTQTDNDAVELLVKPEMLFGAERIFNFYKRGYSKKGEVEENVEYLHIVKYSTSLELGDRLYYSIVLADLNSVVLIPHSIWAESTHYKAKGEKAYNTNCGLTRPRTDLSQFQLYLTMYRLSHTLKMIEQFKKNEPYNYKEHADELTRMSDSSKDKGYLKLFQVASPKVRKTVEALAKAVSSGVVKGMWVSPAVSKSGKAAVGAIQREYQFATEVSNALEGRQEVDVSFKRNRPSAKKKENGKEGGSRSKVLDKEQ